MTSCHADAADAAPDEIVRLLRLLARAGSVARRDADGALLVADARRPSSLFPATIAEAALAAEWIVLAGDGTVGLTRSGRAHLRRALSRSGAPAAGAGDKAASPLARDCPEQGDDTTPAISAPAIDLKESPLAWLARRQRASGEPLISQAQLQAGERFRADFWYAGLSPRVTSSWSATATGSRSRKGGGRCPAEASDAAIAARQRVGKALHAVGPELGGILVDVCGHLKGLEEIERQSDWPKRSAKVILDLALSALARHYGLESVPNSRGSRRTAHWGVSGYRPPAEAPETASGSGAAV